MDGTGLFNGQHMKNVAQGGVDDANEEEIGQGLPRQPLEKRDILEHGQSQLSKQRASNLRPAQQQKGAQLQTAPEKAAAGDHQAAGPGRLPLAQHRVGGEKQGGQHRQCHAGKADRTAAQPGNGPNAQHLQDQSQKVVPGNGFMEKEKGQKGDKDRIAGKQHRHHVGLPVGDGQLIEDHGQRHAKKPCQSKGPHVPPGQANPLPPQGPPRHREQTDPPHQEPLQRDLHGVKGPRHSGEFEQDFHGGKDHRRQGDEQAAEEELAFQYTPPLVRNRSYSL